MAKKRGKRKYRMSAKALAQRRVAARKHGQRASTPLRQILPGCNTRGCPLVDADGNSGYPCKIKEGVEVSGGAVEVCPLPLAVNPEVKAAFQKALRDGDLAGLEEVTAISLAAQTELALTELDKIKREGGFSVEFELPVGETTVTATKKNPRADPTLKLLEQLGHTAAQQAITPKSQGERKRDEGIGGFLSEIERLGKLKPAEADA